MMQKNIARYFVMGVGLCFTVAGTVIGLVLWEHLEILVPWVTRALATIVVCVIPVSLMLFGLLLSLGSWLVKEERKNETVEGGSHKG